MTNTKSTTPVTADTAKTEAAAKPKTSATKSETTPKAKPARATPKATPKASTSSKVKAPVKKTRQSKTQSAKDLLSNQDNDAPDLNTSTDYPIHPKRIWPD